MGEYAFYRAVTDDALAAARNGDEPGLALGELTYGHDAEGPDLDLTNTFGALLYVLIGPDGDAEDFDDPLVAAVVGHEEVAFDSPAVNTVEWTRDIDRALSAFDRSSIAERFDPSDMDDQGVEPGGFADDPEWLGNVIESFDLLRDFYAFAARDGRAVLVNIS